MCVTTIGVDIIHDDILQNFKPMLIKSTSLLGNVVMDYTIVTGNLFFCVYHLKILPLIISP